MNQKPSEKIKEMQGITQEQLEFYQGDVGKWIIQYLDAEWEKNKPCEHLYESGYVCKKCGFSMIQPV